MNKEELQDKGWVVTYSGVSPVPRWGQWMVCVRHAAKGSIHGYGDSEERALVEIEETMQKREKASHEVSH